MRRGFGVHAQLQCALACLRRCLSLSAQRSGLDHVLIAAVARVLPCKFSRRAQMQPSTRSVVAALPRSRPQSRNNVFPGTVCENTNSYRRPLLPRRRQCMRVVFTVVVARTLVVGFGRRVFLTGLGSEQDGGLGHDN